MDPSPHYSQVPDSFRHEFTERTPGFRTPTPPLSSIEPLSPIRRPADHFDEAAPVRKRRRHEGPPDYKTRWPRVAHASLAESIQNDSKSSHTSIALQSKPTHPHNATYYRSQLSPTALDVFATVATSPDLSQDGFGPPEVALSPWSRHHHVPSAARGSKRSHSEIIDWRPQQQNPPRPSTSYATGPMFQHDRQSVGGNGEMSIHQESVPGDGNRDYGTSAMRAADSRLEDAELLLGFARGGGNVAQHSRQYPPRTNVKIEDGRVNSNSWHSQPGGTVYADVPNPGPPSQVHGSDAAASYKTNISQTELHDVISNSWPANTPTQEPAKKPRVHKGWPKGKPRGKRSDATKAVQTKKPTKRVTKSEKANQSQRSQKAQASLAARLAALEDYQLPQRPNSADGYSKSNLISTVNLIENSDRAASVPADVLMVGPPKKAARTSSKNEVKVSICALCQNTNSPNGYHDLWITCNGCKEWYHIVCVGFKTEREVRDVDKFYCPSCEPKHGKTTFVRKSSRAHVSVDYAGLNEGQLRTATDTVEHHFIQPIKDGTFEFLPEKFPRMPPELVTAEFFERSGTMTEPVLIPATMNPQPDFPQNDLELGSHPNEGKDFSQSQNAQTLYEEFEYDCVPDDGQDKLDMVMPKGLTVRRVAELLGPTRPLQVIDVKSQDQGDTTWNLGKWADYYEAPGEKPVRNVISLEVSRTKLSRLIRRPKIVRDLDLQDQIWPREELENGKYPQVQFYCLMSVADCYTDFHIDFGGSSVYYHILKGKKTFFFIPPKKQHLKKYEEWCISPNQESVFLGNLTKECYRVDLSEGDTMLIPSGWIHAVWTPENSLVVGGNFLTRMHYGMQIQVNEIEKNTGVARMFRYPSFQKVLWYTVIQYLQQDPIPYNVAQTLYNGDKFERRVPVYQEFENDEDEESEYYNARYYSEGEIDGLNDLLGYVFRTVMISLGLIQLPKTKRDAVIRSLPKGYGDHLNILKTFALWIAWKRGNEELPVWAQPDAPLSELEAAMAEKKSGPVVTKKNDRDVIPERRSQRQPPKAKETEATPQTHTSSAEGGQNDTPSTDAQSTGRVWCEACRRSRVRCQHREPGDQQIIRESFGIQSGTLSPAEAHAPAVQDSLPAEEPSSETTIMPDASVTNPPNPSAVDIDMSSGRQTPAPTGVNANSSSNIGQVRIKACEECRKSKRRCIHDADGNIDPVKAMQNPVPRAFSATKRARHDKASNDLPAAKRAKTSLSGGEMSPDGINGDHQQGPGPFKTGASSEERATISPLETEPTANTSTSAYLISDIYHNSSLYGSDQPKRPTQSAASSPHGSASDEKCATQGQSSDAHIGTSVSNEPNEEIKSFVHHEQSKLDSIGTSIVGNDIGANRSGSETRSRTPSLHVQTNSTESLERSRSPPTSPLTEVGQSSPIQPKQEEHAEDVPQMHLAAPRQPGRPKKSDRLEQSAEPGSPQTPNAVNELGAWTSTSKSSRKSAGRRSNASRSVSAENSGNGQMGSPVAVMLPKFHAISPIEGVVEDESMRLARQLQEQEFGLRQRSK